ncbi:hypothetical protein STEG23_034853 [Scotinomys teguina]
MIMLLLVMQTLKTDLENNIHDGLWTWVFQKVTNNKKQFQRLPDSENSNQKVSETETLKSSMPCKWQMHEGLPAFYQKKVMAVVKPKIHVDMQLFPMTGVLVMLLSFAASEGHVDALPSAGARDPATELSALFVRDFPRVHLPGCRTHTSNTGYFNWKEKQGYKVVERRLTVGF